MFEENNLSVFDALSKSIRNSARLCYSEIENIQFEENMTPSGMSHLQSAKLCTFFINRILCLMDIWFGSTHFFRDSLSEELDIESIIEGMGKHLAGLLPTMKPEIKYSPRAAEGSTVITERSRLEFILLNILYCCARNERTGSKLKITFGVTEKHNDVIFHIHDNCKNLDPCLSDDPITELNRKIDNASPNNAAMLLSIAVADKTVREIGGHIEYTPLKHGNRFDIHVPRAADALKERMSSPVIYTPNTSLFQQMLADVIAEIGGLR